MKTCYECSGGATPNATAYGIMFTSGKIVTVNDLGADTWNNSHLKCDAYRGGSFTWHLPSNDELVSLADNLSFVQSRLSEEGCSGLPTNHYWSSTIPSSSPFARSYVSLYNGTIYSTEYPNHVSFSVVCMTDY